MYKTEQALVDEFVSVLKQTSTPWGPLRVGKEFFYHRGRTDVIALRVNGCVIAFEAKLTKWRTALDQAYKNTCFAHNSYVLLPEGVALSAYKYAAEFERRGVGLCYICQHGVVILREAGDSQPLQPWLSNQATYHASV